MRSRRDARPLETPSDIQPPKCRRQRHINRRSGRTVAPPLRFRLDDKSNPPTSLANSRAMGDASTRTAS